jgi:protein-tyrosine-phosphatase/predicted ATP-grasp superfamily ATP-dependent carboligase
VEVKQKPVLILGSSPRFVLPVARGLHSYGIPAGVAALGHFPVIRSRSVESFIQLADAQQDPNSFLQGLTDHMQSYKFDMLIPTSDSALSAVLAHYDAFESLLQVACPPPDILRVALDKRLTLEAARRCGVPVSPTFVLSGPDELVRQIRDLRFPIIAKPGSKSGPLRSFKYRYFETRDDLEKAFEAEPGFGKGLIFQEFCPGEGVGVEILLHRGELLMLFQHRRLKEFPSTGGIGILVISEEPDPVLSDYALRLLRHIGWDGIAMVEFRHDRTRGKVELIEINGRYWGSVALSYHAGLNPGFYQWQILHGQVPRPPAYKIGVRARWTAGYILRLHSAVFADANERPHQTRHREVLNLLLDLRPSIADMVWSPLDPVPAILEIAQTLGNLLAKDCRRLLQRIMPSGLVKVTRTGRSLETRSACFSYLRMVLLRKLKIRNDASRRIPASAKRILFVCHGNIIRSPMAEALMKRCLGPSAQDIIWVGSAGLVAKNSTPADERALSVCRDFGVSLDEHRAVRLTPELVERSDVIFVMDYLIEAQLLSLYPTARHKIYLLGSYAACSNGKLEIDDPYLGHISDVRACYEVLERAVQNLARQSFAENSGARKDG